MPKYIARVKSFIGNRIVEEGEIVDYEGDVSDNLELVMSEEKEAEAQAPKAQAPKAQAPKAQAPKAQAPKAQAPEAQAPETNPTDAGEGLT